MKNYFKLILYLLILVMCISTSKIEAKENDNVTEVKIYVQGKLLEADDFIIKKERTFLPLRLIGES